MRVLTIPLAAMFGVCFLLGLSVFAHNGKIGYARPLGKIVVDGDFSDWPKNASKYVIDTYTSDTRAKDGNDFSGFFQVGYRLEDRSLYLAFTITDDDFIEDTSSNVRWNTQDGLELNIDARHLPSVSGVASFMYSQKLRNINRAMFDPFAKNASWDIAEVARVTRGNTRYYEWRIQLGEQLQVGKSVGIDFQCFDKDGDSTFTYSSWGKGGFKYRDPKSLGDIVFVPANVKLATISGQVDWNREVNVKLPSAVRFTSVRNANMWATAEVDSTGKYVATLPAGDYNIVYAADHFTDGKNLYEVKSDNPVVVTARTGQHVKARDIGLMITRAPDLIPEKGVLHAFDDAAAIQVDSFIETYRRYYDIPGISLALIKDGKLVYHKTYGVRNSFTNEKVDEQTLFEAASITKPVFAFAVQRLAERGVIDLNKPLYEYLPYKDIEYDDRYKLMTAKHVLTHRTGFPNWRYMNPDNKLNLLFTPGTKFNYSGEGFEYLKMVVEKVTGKKVEQVLQEEVIEPMRLYHTFFSKNDSLVRMAASGHHDMLPSDKQLPEQPGMAYSMQTEAKVFSNFMIYLLEQRGLNEETYKTMMEKHSEYEFDADDEKPAVPTYMGMSLEIRETPYGKSFGHGGNNGDFKCRFEVFKDLKMGYAVFTNSNTSDALLYAALGKFLIEGKDKAEK